MKTTKTTRVQKSIDQLKVELINYLTKTSKHTFVKKDEKDNYFKLINNDGKFKILKKDKKSGHYNILDLNLDYYLKYLGPNSKCILKNMLFLNNNYISIKNTNFVKYEISEIEKYGREYIKTK